MGRRHKGMQLLMMVTKMRMITAMKMITAKRMVREDYDSNVNDDSNQYGYEKDCDNGEDSDSNKDDDIKGDFFDIIDVCHKLFQFSAESYKEFKELGSFSIKGVEEKIFKDYGPGQVETVTRIGALDALELAKAYLAAEGLAAIAEAEAKLEKESR